MNDRRPQKSPLSEARIAALLERVGERPQPDEGAMERVREAVHDAWQSSLAARRARRRRWVGLAAAASVVLALGTGLLIGDAQPPGEIHYAQALPGGTMEWRSGARADGAWASLAASRTLVSGDTVRTGNDSYGVLAMSTGAALRLDAGTELEMTGGDEIYLRRGAVYVEAPGAATLAIRTDHGLARDIGTRYEVRVGDRGWRVQVREGRVVMNDALAGEVTADAGERIVAQDAAFARERVGSTDASWQWTHRAAPPMAIEGAVLNDYLVWWSRETGIAVRYQRPIDEAIAAQTQLHGSLEGLSLEDGFGAVTRGAGYRVVDRTASQVMLAR